MARKTNAENPSPIVNVGGTLGLAKVFWGLNDLVILGTFAIVGLVIGGFFAKTGGGVGIGIGIGF